MPAVQQWPDQPDARLNQAWALLQNGEAGRARPLLASLAGAELNPSEQALHHFLSLWQAWLAHQGQEARRNLGQQSPHLLFPTQRLQLAALAKGLL